MISDDVNASLDLLVDNIQGGDSIFSVGRRKQGSLGRLFEKTCLLCSEVFVCVIGNPVDKGDRSMQNRQGQNPSLGSFF